MSGAPALIWRRWLAVLFVVLALAGCAQGITGQTGTPYARHPPETNGITPEHGGGDGGGGGGGMWPDGSS